MQNWEVSRVPISGVIETPGSCKWERSKTTYGTSNSDFLEVKLTRADEND